MKREDEERQSHPEMEAGAEDSPPVDQDYRRTASGRQHPRLRVGEGGRGGHESNKAAL